MNKYCYNFKIADIRIRILSDVIAETDQAFRAFAETENTLEEPDYVVYVQVVSTLRVPEGICVYSGAGTSVIKIQENIYVRVLRELHGENKEYAVSFFDWENRVIRVEILEEKKIHAESILPIFKCIAWESLVLHEKRLMLHASYIASRYGGIAFSGPSGIGKTTQAKLWCTYKDAKMLNGDKVILYKKGKSWSGYGSPYAGSSGCHVNDQCELKYLIFLKQGKTCSLRKLSLAERFKWIYTGLTLNRWDTEYVQIACELVEHLASDIQIYEFTCTPDETAVNFLQRELEGGLVCG